MGVLALALASLLGIGGSGVARASMAATPPTPPVPLAKTRYALQRYFHGLPLHGPFASVQASGATAFNSLVDITRHGGVDVRRVFAEAVAEQANQVLCPHVDADADGGATRRAPLDIIDVGCGVGSLTRRLRHAFGRLGHASSLCGVDTSAAMLAQAAQEVKGVSFFHLNAVDVVGPHDVATVAFLMHELPAEAAREVLTGLLDAARVVYVLDVTPASLSESYLLKLFEPFIREYRDQFEDTARDLGGETVEDSLLPASLMIWAFRGSQL